MRIRFGIVFKILHLCAKQGVTQDRLYNSFIQCLCQTSGAAEVAPPQVTNVFKVNSEIDSRISETIRNNNFEYVKGRIRLFIVSNVKESIITSLVYVLLRLLSEDDSILPDVTFCGVSKSQLLNMDTIEPIDLISRIIIYSTEESNKGKENPKDLTKEWFLEYAKIDRNITVDKSVWMATGDLLKIDTEEKILLIQSGNRCALCDHEFSTKAKEPYKEIKIYSNSIAGDLLLSPALSAKGIHAPAHMDDFNNRILVCPSCAKKYNTSPTVEYYEKLAERKKAQLTRDNTKNLFHEGNLDNLDMELQHIVKNLKIERLDLNNEPLKTEALTVDSKIHDYSLREEIIPIVIRKFNYIQSLFSENSQNVLFDNIAMKVRAMDALLTLQGYSQNEAFDYLVKLIMDSVEGATASASRAIVAFFVQDCEVFSEK